MVMFILGVSLTINALFAFLFIYGNYMEKYKKKELTEAYPMSYKLYEWMYEA